LPRAQALDDGQHQWVAILINRSVPVDVPEEFVFAIRNMTTSVVDEKGNPAGEQPRFNITDHGAV
jgi:hypothetical protein